LSTVAKPGVVARQADIFDVFVADMNGQIHTIWWTVASGWAPAFLALDALTRDLSSGSAQLAGTALNAIQSVGTASAQAQ
jgi:hypothetical protein